VVVGQRLAPVGEREVGLDLLRGVKLLPRLFVAEAVENRDAADEVLLRLLARGGREVDRSDIDRGVEVGHVGGLGRRLRTHGDGAAPRRQTENRNGE